jgi:hypothetical protein
MPVVVHGPPPVARRRLVLLHRESPVVVAVERAVDVEAVVARREGVRRGRVVEHVEAPDADLAVEELVRAARVAADADVAMGKLHAGAVARELEAAVVHVLERVRVRVEPVHVDPGVEHESVLVALLEEHVQVRVVHLPDQDVLHVRRAEGELGSGDGDGAVGGAERCVGVVSGALACA